METSCSWRSCWCWCWCWRWNRLVSSAISVKITSEVNQINSQAYTPAIIRSKLINQPHSSITAVSSRISRPRSTIMEVNKVISRTKAIQLNNIIRQRNTRLAFIPARIIRIRVAQRLSIITTRATMDHMAVVIRTDVRTLEFAHEICKKL